MYDFTPAEYEGFLTSRNVKIWVALFILTFNIILITNILFGYINNFYIISLVGLNIVCLISDLLSGKIYTERFIILNISLFLICIINYLI